MKDLRELFIKHLTEDIEPNKASAIFDKESGKRCWAEITLSMIMKAFDNAVSENLKYEVEWVDLNGADDEEPEVIMETLSWEEFNGLCEYADVGLMYINKWLERIN